MANVEPQAMAQNDTDVRVQLTSAVIPQSSTLEIHYQSRITDLWTLLHTSLLAKWIQPTPSALPPQEKSSKKSHIAQRIYNAYKKFELKEWLEVKEIDPVLNAKPNRTHKKHSNCYALLLVWEEDDIGGALNEAEALKRELEERWGFWGDVYRIPFVEEKTAQQEVVENAVNTFIEHRDGDSNLLLTHYGGHGSLNNWNEYVLQGSNNGKLHEVKLKPIRERLRECKADVGIFLDACYSEAGVHRSVQPHTVEVLAACAEENTTVGVSPESFTSGIIRVLRYQEETLNIHEISEELMKLTYPKLGNKPVHRLLKLSVWGSIQFRRETGGKAKYSKIRPLFAVEDTE